MTPIELAEEPRREREPKRADRADRAERKVRREPEGGTPRRGVLLGAKALMLLYSSIIIFGLAMFGIGFFSGAFFKERSPTETVIRHESAPRPTTLQQLTAQGGSPPPTEQSAEVESLAQVTGSLEDTVPGQPLPQTVEGQALEPEQQLTVLAETEPLPTPLSPADESAREQALAELRAGQVAAPEHPTQPAPPPVVETAAGATGPYSVQVGAFIIQNNALELVATLVGRGYDAWLASEKDVEGRAWFFVRVGRYPNREEAVIAAATFRQRENVNAVAVPIASAAPTPPGGVAQPTAQTTTQTAPPVAEQPATPPAGQGREVFVVHVGAFGNAQDAREAARPLLEQGYVPCVASIVDEQHQTWHLVEVVEFPTRTEAQAFIQQAGQRGNTPPLKVRQINTRSVTGRHCF